MQYTNNNDKRVFKRKALYDFAQNNLTLSVLNLITYFQTQHYYSQCISKTSFYTRVVVCYNNRLKFITTSMHYLELCKMKCSLTWLKTLAETYTASIQEI